MDDLDINSVRLWFELADTDFLECAFGVDRLGRVELLR